MNDACRHKDRQDRKPCAWKLVVCGGLLVMETDEWLGLGGVHVAIQVMISLYPSGSGGHAAAVENQQDLVGASHQQDDVSLEACDG